MKQKIGRKIIGKKTFTSEAENIRTDEEFLTISGHVLFLAIVQPPTTALVTEQALTSHFLIKWRNEFRSICEVAIPGVLKNIRDLFHLLLSASKVFLLFPFLKKKLKMGQIISTSCLGLGFQDSKSICGWRSKFLRHFESQTSLSSSEHSEIQLYEATQCGSLLLTTQFFFINIYFIY